MFVDGAMYVDGRRAATIHSVKEIAKERREQRGTVWIGLREPTEQEFAAVASEFELHSLAVEDAIKAGQRPKLERYGGVIFVVLWPACYREAPETVDFGEIHVFTGDDFVITVRHGEIATLGQARERLEAEPTLLCRGAQAILYAIMDQVVDDYAPVVEGLENDVDEIESQVFGDEGPDPSRRIYELSREAIRLQRATRPLADLLGRLVEDDDERMDPEVKRHLRDVRDHTLRAGERVEGFRELLSNILSVNLTMSSVEQSDQAKKISGWGAILFTPTLIGTVYGMNFQNMPELSWTLGYPMALGLMALVAIVLYLVFRRAGWL